MISQDEASSHAEEVFPSTRTKGNTIFVYTFRKNDNTHALAVKRKLQVGESRLYLKDSENKCSVPFPYHAPFGMIHDAPMWRIAAFALYASGHRLPELPELTEKIRSIRRM